MAIKTGDKPKIPRSTGAVKTPTDPVAVSQTVDNSSAGVHETAGPVESTIPHDISNKTVVRYDTPGPVTMSLGWLPEASDADTSNEAQAKVIAAPKKQSPRKSAAKVGTK